MNTQLFNADAVRTLMNVSSLSDQERIDSLIEMISGAAKRGHYKIEIPKLIDENAQRFLRERGFKTKTVSDSRGGEFGTKISWFLPDPPRAKMFPVVEDEKTEIYPIAEWCERVKNHQFDGFIGTCYFGTATHYSLSKVYPGEADLVSRFNLRSELTHVICFSAI